MQKLRFATFLIKFFGALFYKKAQFYTFATTCVGDIKKEAVRMHSLFAY